MATAHPTTDHAPHASAPRTYAIVFVALLALTAATVTSAYADLGPWHTAVALLIAVAKAVLIVVFFMHAREGGKLVWAVIAAAVLFLAIMLGLTLTDYWTRGVDHRLRNPAPASAR
jgi:cytochrome c oxidase subunit 4